MNPDTSNATVSNPASPLAYHTDFLDFLSFEELLKSFIQLLDHIYQAENFHLFNAADPNTMQIANLIDVHSERILTFLQMSSRGVTAGTILESLKLSMQPAFKILGNKKHFQHLKFLLLQTSEDKQDPIRSSTPSYAEGMPTFDNALVNAILHEEFIDTFLFDLKNSVQNFGADPAFMQGLLRALQKDYIKLNNWAFQKCNGLTPDVQEHAASLISTLFPLLVDLAKKDLSYVSKNIIDFSFEMTNPNEEFRIITWTQWRWVRVLATRTWDASLREPPSWVTAGGSLYCATLFDCADSIWLQEYAHHVLERVYAETLVDGFEPTPEHYDYVEFLARNLKKKWFHLSRHSHITLALKLISRLTPREMKGILNSEAITELNSENFYSKHKNPVSQALAVLLQMTS